jgi:hypothetical protein
MPSNLGPMTLGNMRTNGVRNETEHEDSFEKFLDDQIRRRFGEWIARATERKNKTDNDA